MEHVHVVAHAKPLSAVPEGVAADMELQKLRARTSRLTLELKASKGEATKLQSELLAKLASRATVEEDNAKMRENLKEARAKSAEMRRKSQHEIAELRKTSKARRSKLAEAEVEAKHKDAMWLATKKELAQVSMRFASKLSLEKARHERAARDAADRFEAAVAAGAAATRLIQVVVGVEWEDLEWKRRSLGDQLRGLRLEVEKCRVERERFGREMDASETRLKERSAERDAAVVSAQKHCVEIDKMRSELKSLRSTSSKLSDEATQQLQSISRLTDEKNRLRETTGELKTELEKQTKKSKDLETKLALSQDARQAQDAVLAGLQQARLRAESMSQQARRRAVKTDMKLQRGAKAAYDAAEARAANALEAIVRDKAEATRRAEDASQARRNADIVIDVLTERCVFLSTELKAAAEAETAWREERALLRAALRDAQRVPVPVEMMLEDAFEHAAAERAAVEALESMAADGARALLARAREVDEPPRIIATRKNGDWVVEPKDAKDAGGAALVERLALPAFLRSMSQRLARDCPSHDRDDHADTLAETLAKKVAETATAVRCVEAASARQCSRLRADLATARAELVNLDEIGKTSRPSAAEVSLEKHAKVLLVGRYAADACRHSGPVCLDLSGLRLDDEACLRALRAMAPRGPTDAVSHPSVVAYDTASRDGTPYSRLTRIVLSDNAVGDVGAKFIGQHVVPAAPFLTLVDLSRNSVSEAGRAALEDGARRNRTFVRIETLVDSTGSSVVCWRRRESPWDAPATIRDVVANCNNGCDPAAPLVIDLRHNSSRAHPGVSLTALRAVSSEAARASLLRSSHAAPRATKSCRPRSAPHSRVVGTPLRSPTKTLAAASSAATMSDRFVVYDERNAVIKRRRQARPVSATLQRSKQQKNSKAREETTQASASTPNLHEGLWYKEN